VAGAGAICSLFDGYLTQGVPLPICGRWQAPDHKMLGLNNLTLI
jgi:hypothetical protein